MYQKLETPILVRAGAAVCGSLERAGKLGTYFDAASSSDRFGAKTWESAESEMLRLCIETVLLKENLSTKKIGLLFCGDLLNQCTASSFGALGFSIPFVGLYGACSTFVEGICLASLALNASNSGRAISAACSHFCTAERQYRFPLEYGCQRTPTSQRTVTGAGCLLLERTADVIPEKVCVTEIQFGKICDMGVTDANNMGAAMAPAAADTLNSYFKYSQTRPEDFDLILTGDLGKIGLSLLRELCAEEGYVLGNNFRDCGCEIFNENQDVHAGASGCGCSAIYTGGYLEKVWRTGLYSNVLLVGTGALLSPLTVMQKESIPGIAHLVRFERRKR